MRLCRDCVKRFTSKGDGRKAHALYVKKKGGTDGEGRREEVWEATSAS